MVLLETVTVPQTPVCDLASISALQIFRVVRFEPEDEDREPVLFVFQRIEDEEDDEDEDEEVSETGALS